MMAATLAIAVWSASLVAAEPVDQSTNLSVFIMPANPNEGHDPFFPNSIRPYRGAMLSTNSPVTAAALTVQGITRMNGNYLAIIDNQTFGVGDDEEVTTPQGSVHVRCLEITANSVVVEVNGRRQELSFSDNP
ncbi:MAG TPA: hypothetical protein VMA13_03795 [Candidatus Saccharimonadales bacterium]|nr:hypothetical protein [Candidatus Saccharimonadales bacterium]